MNDANVFEHLHGIIFLKVKIEAKGSGRMSNSTLFSGSEKIKFALIATYPEMSKVFIHMAKKEGVIPYNRFAAFDEAVAVAQKIETHVDAILSRGGTGQDVKDSVDIPVILIPITPFDVVQSMLTVRKDVKEVAFFNYKRNIYGIRDIEKMFGKTIIEYTFINGQDIKNGVKDVKKRGIRTLIGGDFAVQLAQREGIEGIEISAGEETVYRAILEALHVVQVRKIERCRTARLNVVLDSIAEGIIVSDNQNKVTLYNPAAERIFKLPRDEVIGANVEEIIPNTRIHKVLEKGEPEIACLQKINGGIITTSRLPIFLDQKPIGVACTFQDVTRIQYLEQKIRREIHAKGFIAKYHFADIITNDSEIKKIIDLAGLYAMTDSSVLIEGESGTGKELFAQSIHNASQRVNGPFIAVNCAAIPEHLLESELFGYEGGAFTGAKKEGKLGLFEAAHNGTIFLDEIGEIPKSLQARLLRVLQEKEIMRIGGDKIIPVDIRIISATNKNLLEKIESGDFRKDLYYRLNVFNLKIPPLRERKDDILLLAKYFSQNQNVILNLDSEKELRQSMLNYNWPGNIRELHNVIERLSLVIKYSQIKTYQGEMLNKILFDPALQSNNLIPIKVNIDKGLKAALSQIEKEIIEMMLVKYNNDHDIVAEKLGIGRTTLWRKSTIK